MKKPTLSSILITSVFGFATSLQAANNWTPAELPTELWFDAADSATVVHSSIQSVSGTTSRATADTPPKRPQATAPPFGPSAQQQSGSSLRWFERQTLVSGWIRPGDAVVVFKRSNKNQPVVELGAGGNRGLVGEGYPTWNSHNNYSTDGYALEATKPDSSVVQLLYRF